MLSDERTEQNLREGLQDLSAAWESAMVSNDAGAIGRFMAEDWMIVSERGATKRDDFLTVVASGDLTHETFNGEVISVRPYGEAAVLTGRVRNSGHYKGQPFSADEWTTDIFVKHHGRWVCVHSHITTVKEA